MSGVEERGGRVVVRVRVQPRASRETLSRDAAGRLRVALTAPPVEGAANEALRAFLARRLGVSRSAVALVGGEKSRDKTVAVSGLDAATVRERLGDG